MSNHLLENVKVSFYVEKKLEFFEELKSLSFNIQDINIDPFSICFELELNSFVPSLEKIYTIEIVGNSYKDTLYYCTLSLDKSLIKGIAKGIKGSLF